MGRALRRGIEQCEFDRGQLSAITEQLLERKRAQIALWSRLYSPSALAEVKLNSSILAGLIETADRADCLVELLSICVDNSDGSRRDGLLALLQLLKNYDGLLRP